MEIRLAIAAFEMVDDGSVSVSAVCRQLGISRDTFYRYRRRFRGEGWPGLLPVSSRPAHSPAITTSAMVEQLIAKRVWLIDHGWDSGARSVYNWLAMDGVTDLPQPRTIHRVFVRAGLIEAQPQKRPRSSFKRFEHPRPNSCWQLDGTGWHLADQSLVCILRVIDDHSRLILASLAANAETTVNAWACLETALERHGVPTMLLHDGGSAFTARRIRGGISDFEARVRALGINPVVSSPNHPQTCGKKERDWQPLKKWLTVQPPATTLAELQRLLDAYDVLFNTQRPHQGIGGTTPARRYTATEKAEPTPGRAPSPVTVVNHKVDSAGRVHLGGPYRISLGYQWAGQTLTIVREDFDVVILHGSTVVHRLVIDPTRKSQALGRPRTRRTKKQLSETS